ncbi:Transposase DDE domain-containing protein [Paracoccus pantotrophus]|nr:Transposase DDE domain-containing protein [Paracoccus pantotrophus]
MAWHAPHEGRPGRPPVFLNAAILFCLSIKVLFTLPLRQAAGMVSRLLRLAGLDRPVPDDSTLRRRQKTVEGHIPSPRCRAAEPAGEQHRDQVPRRRGIAGAQAWCSEPSPMVQGPSGHGHRHIRHPRGEVHPQPGRRQPRPAGPAGPDPRRCGDRHRDRRRRLRQPPLPQRHHRVRWHGNHPDPQDWSSVEGGQPSRPAPEQNPARHAPLRPRVLETMDRIPCPQPSRGKDALPQGIRRAHRRKRPRPPNRRNRGELRVALMNRFNALGTAEIVRGVRT